VTSQTVAATPHAATSERRPWLRRLHVRAALMAIPLWLALGVTMVALLRHYSAQTALEAGQRMNLGLASYVVDHQAPDLIDANGLPDKTRMQDLAMHVMMISPAVEVYLLNAQGRVLAHALDKIKGLDPVGSSVDLTPVHQMLHATALGDVMLPVLGADPRQPGRRDTFSVAVVPGEKGPRGYLYIVLNGAAAQASPTAPWWTSDAMRAMAAAVGLSMLVASLVLWWVWRRLTQPLRRLTDELQAFRVDAREPAAHDASDEIDVLKRATHAMQQRIAHQFERLEEGDRQRRELVSNISHDLRTPLSSIQGYVETVLLRGDALDAATRATHLRTALRQVDVLGKRIADLFELSKLDAGRVQPHCEVFCLAELLQDVVQNYQLTAQQRGVSMALSVGSHTQAKVLADIALIERVLQNLVDNALRYTPAGGTVVLAVERQGSSLQVSVSDTGRGIAKQHMAHIFERYWRADDMGDAAMAGPSNSAGLGLAIVKRILDLHGSVMRVQSELKRGTRFEFLLPQAG
jgi:two-component system, OmpR family, sensor kinase